MISKLTQLVGELCLILSKNRTAYSYAVVKKSRPIYAQSGSKFPQILLILLISFLGFTNNAFSQCALVCNDVTVSLDGNGNGTLVFQDIGGSNGACGIVTYTLSQSNFDCFDIGTVPVTLTATDGAGLSNSCTRVVTVEDNIAPNITCPPGIFVDCGDPTITPGTGMPVTSDNSDNCGFNINIRSSDAFIAGTNGNCQTIERTFTAVDTFNNTNNCIQLIEVDDNEDPILTFGPGVIVPPDITITCDSFPLLPPRTATMTDDCAGDRIILATEVNNQMGNSLVCGFYDYTIVRTWTAEDNCGNTDVHTQVITVANVPTFPNAPTTENISANSPQACPTICSAQLNLDLTPYLDYNCGNPDSLLTTSFEVLDATGATVFFGPGLIINSSCLAAGVYDANFSAEDFCGNKTTHTVLVTIADNLPPTAVCKPSISVPVPSSGALFFNQQNIQSLLDDGSFDNCGTPLTYSVDTLALDCRVHSIGSTVDVTMTVSNGNLSSVGCTTTITILNNPPVPYCKDITVELDTNGDYIVQANEIDDLSIDQCEVIATYEISLDGTNFSGNLPLTCADLGTVAAVLRVTDVSGLFADCNANITVVDDQDVVANCGFNTFDVFLGQDGKYTFSDTDTTTFKGLFSDNCDFDIALDVVTFDCADVDATGTTLLTVAAVDSNGNVLFDMNGDSIACEVNVSIMDLEAPIISCANITVELDGSGDVVIDPTNMLGGSIFFQNGENGSGTNGNNEICITAANASTFSFDYSFFPSGTSNHAFGYLINGIYTPVLVQTSPVSVTLNAGDNFCFRFITLDNLASSTLEVFNFSQGLSGDFAIANWDAPTSFNSDGSIIFNDACGIDRYEIQCVDSTTWSETLSFDCTDIKAFLPATAGGVICGPVTKEFNLRAIDVNEQFSSTCTSTITFIDKQPPVPVCDAKTISLSTGAVVVPAYLFDDGSFDGCGIMAPMAEYEIARPGDGFYQAKLTFDCDSVGVFPISLRVEDCSGNEAFCATTITVQENQPPKIHCSPDITLDCTQSISPNVTGFPLLVMDACSANVDTTFNDVLSTTDPFVCGTFERTWTATDASGNQTSCLQLITLTDTIAPTFTVPADTILAQCENPDDVFGITGYPIGVQDQCDLRPSVQFSDAGFVGSYAFSNWMLSVVGTGTGGGVSVFGGCAPTAFINANENRLFLDFESPADALDFFNESGGNVVMTVNPGGSGMLVQTANTARLRIDITTLTAGPYSGTITSPIGRICTYANGEFSIDAIQISGTDDFECSTTVAPSEVNYSITIPFDGNLKFEWEYVSSDSTGTGSDDPFGYILNGVFVPLSGTASTSSNVANIAVVAGDMFAFSQQTNTSSCGGAMTTIRNFRGPGGCNSSFVRTWSVEDDCGNANIQDQMITLDISNAPTITFNNTMQIDSASAGNCSGAAVIDFSNAVSGNCGGIVITNDAMANFGVGDGSMNASGIYPVGINIITFTVSSSLGCFNDTTHVLTLTVKDNTSPFLTCTNSLQTVFLNSGGQGILGTTPGLFNASDDCGIASVSIFPVNFDCTNLGTVPNVVLTATDPSGNSNSCNLNVNVVDNSSAATLSCPADIIVDCSQSTGITGIYGTPTTGGVCGTNAAVIAKDSLISGSATGCFVLERTWTDGTNSCLQTISIEDNIAPVLSAAPADITINFSDPNPATTLSFTDDCTNGTVTSTDDNSNRGMDRCLCTNYNYDITRSWIASDGCGNTHTLSQIITVEDVTNPTFSFPDSIVVNNASGFCGANVSLTLATYINDEAPFNCLDISNNALALFGNGNATNDIDGFYPVGTYDISFVATDPCGNSATEILRLVVIDNDNVALPCISSINLDLNNSGNATIDETDILTGSVIDNCSINSFTFTLSTSSFNCTDIGVKTTTLTATDQNGNQNTCTTTVNVFSTFISAGFASSTTSTAASNLLAADGTATVTVNGSGSYSYLWDDANASTTAVVTGLLPGLYNVTITDTNSGCVYLDDVVVPSLCPTLSLGQISGGVGDLVSIPVFVDNFTNIVSFQFSMNVDPAVAEFTGLASGFTLNGLATGNFSVVMSAGGVITVSWIDPNGNPGTTLPTGTAIFNIEFLITGAPGNTTAVTIDNMPLNYEIGQVLNGSVVSVPGCSNAGEVSVNTSLALAQVCGNISTEDGTPVQNIEVIETSGSGIRDTTDVNGDYCLDVPTGTPVCLEAFNNFNHQGSSSIDLFLIQQHILGNTLFTSPYQVIAADANNSGSVSTLDLVDLQFLILGNFTTLPNHDFWTFVDATQTFSNVLSPFPYDQKINLGTVNSNSIGNTFVAVAVGDVNGTAQTQMTNAPVIRSGNSFDLQLDDKSIKKGETFEVTFNSSEYADIAGYQMTLEFGTDAVQFESVDALHIDNLTANNFALNSAAEGIISLNWYGLATKDFKAEEALFTLKFTALKDIETLQDILSSSSAITAAEAYKMTNNQVEYLDVNLTFNENTVVSSDFSLINNKPNPFSLETTLGFTLPTDSETTITVFDVSGRILMQVNKEFYKGYNEMIINASELDSSGVLYYEVKTNEHNATGRMLLLK